MYLVKIKNLPPDLNPGCWRNSAGNITYAIVTARYMGAEDYENRLYWPDLGEDSGVSWPDYQLEFIGVLT